MIFLLTQGQWSLFALLLIALVLSLSFHEFGHAAAAKWQGDDTAAKQGRLTLNPIAHIDPFGLLMVVMVGFGYAKPVPVDLRNLRSRWSNLYVSAAGPFMNLLLAVASWNSLLWLHQQELVSPGVDLFFGLLAQINLLLMLFNLLPIGPLDGHHIVATLLPPESRLRYLVANARYGTLLLLGLIVADFAGVPVFEQLMKLAQSMLGYISFIDPGALTSSARG